MVHPQHATTDHSDTTAAVQQLKTDLTNLSATVQSLATEHLGAAASSVQREAAIKLNDIESTIRRNPTQAAAIAAGVGFIAGLILRR